MSLPELEEFDFVSSIEFTSWLGPRLMTHDHSRATRVGQHVPSDYAHYVRLWLPQRARYSHRTLGSLEEETLHALLDVLATQTPVEETSWFAYGKSWGGLDRTVSRRTGGQTWTRDDVEQTRFVIPNCAANCRRYVLLSGHLASLARADQPPQRATPQWW